MSSAVAYAPNRYRRVQMNTASLNYAPTKGWVCSSLKGVPLHCIIFRTATEVEILDLILMGKSNRVIAEEFCISENTVKTHVRNILAKYEVKNRTQLISKILMNSTGKQ